MNEAMKKRITIFLYSMVGVTFVALCLLGAWATIYPWPPVNGGRAQDVQNAVFGLWVWLLAIPTIVGNFFWWMFVTDPDNRR